MISSTDTAGGVSAGPIVIFRGNKEIMLD